MEADGRLREADEEDGRVLQVESAVESAGDGRRWIPRALQPQREVWIVERTVSWLSKRRSLRTRWFKKAGNWLALVQLACAHILLNLAVFG